MATAYLNEGSVTLAAAAWSDTTGFADNADLVIDRGGQTITTELDKSALTEGINSLIVSADFYGNIGSATNGPLIVDVDYASSPASYIKYNARGGSFWYRSGGDNTLCRRFIHSGAGTVYYQGGTISLIEASRGASFVNASTVVTTMYVYGGNHVIENNATAITTLVVLGGQVVLKRGVTTLVVGGTGQLVADLESGSLGSTSATMYGGRIDHRAGACPNFVFDAGSYSTMYARRPFTIAGTAGIVGAGCAFSPYDPNGLVTVTTANISPRGGGYIGSGGAGFTGE